MWAQTLLAHTSHKAGCTTSTVLGWGTAVKLEGVIEWVRPTFDTRAQSHTFHWAASELGTAQIAAEHIVRCTVSKLGSGPRGTVGVPWVCPSNRPQHWGIRHTVISHMVILYSHKAISHMAIEPYVSLVQCSRQQSRKGNCDRLLRAGLPSWFGLAI